VHTYLGWLILRTCIWIYCLTQHSPSVCANNDFSTPAHYDSLYATLQQIDLIHSITQQHSHKLGLADNSKEVWGIFNSGRVAGLIGVEGLHQIANSASVLRNFRRLGVRYITLTHDSNNLYADATVSLSDGDLYVM
jgi:membrane dipeptidase